MVNFDSSVLKLLIYYEEKSCKHFKSSKQIRQELKIQMFPHQNYEPLKDNCNLHSPTDLYKKICFKNSKLKCSEYMQNISRSKSFGKFVFIVTHDEAKHCVKLYFN